MPAGLCSPVLGMRVWTSPGATEVTHKALSPRMGEGGAILVCRVYTLILRLGWLRILVAEQGTFLPKRGQTPKLGIRPQSPQQSKR